MKEGKEAGGQRRKEVEQAFSGSSLIDLLLCGDNSQKTLTKPSKLR